jgi:CheY-like chemotaxis protein
MKKSPVSSPQPLSNSIIQIIDDEPDNLDVLGQSLVYYGASVFSAESAEEALADLPRVNPTLIVTDIQMPDVDGFDLFKSLRANPNYASIPVIAITAHAMIGDRERILAAGFEAYIDKPINVLHLPRQLSPFVESPILKNILLISPDYLVDKDLQEQMSDHYHNLYVVRTDQDALHAAKTYRLDLLIMDCNLPYSQDVYALVRSKSPTCPILAMNQPPQNMFDDDRHFDVEAMLHTPFNRANFLDQLKKYFPSIGETTYAV